MAPFIDQPDGDQPTISEIVPGLFICGWQHSYNVTPRFEGFHIRAVISLLDVRVSYWSEEIWTNYIRPGYHLWINCLDTDVQNILQYMEQCCDFIENNLSTIEVSIRESPGDNLDSQKRQEGNLVENKDTAIGEPANQTLEEDLDSPDIKSCNLVENKDPTIEISVNQIKDPNLKSQDEQACDLVENEDTTTEIVIEQSPDQKLNSPDTSSPTREPRPKGVLVHCAQGKSRSPTIVIAYLMRKTGKSVDEVLAQVKEKRGRARPRSEFLSQLRIWEETGYKLWEDDAKTIPKHQ